MSEQITTAYVQAYQSNVIMLSQQLGSVLRNTCRQDGTVVGKTLYFDRIGATAMQRRSTRFGDAPVVHTPHSRRRATAWTYEWGDFVDPADSLRILIDPASKYSVNGGYAAGRTIDDEIVGALGGNSYTGEDGSVVVALPAGQKIAAGGLGLTVGKVIQAKEKLGLSDVDPSIQLYAVVTPKQITDLLNTTEVTSSDFAAVKALNEGTIKYWMGFNWIVTNRLLKPSNRMTYFYAQQAIGMMVLGDIKSDIRNRPDKAGNPIYVEVTMDLGATRIEDEKVIEVECVET